MDRKGDCEGHSWSCNDSSVCLLCLMGEYYDYLVEMPLFPSKEFSRRKLQMFCQNIDMCVWSLTEECGWWLSLLAWRPSLRCPGCQTPSSSSPGLRAPPVTLRDGHACHLGTISFSATNIKYPNYWPSIAWFTSVRDDVNDIVQKDDEINIFWLGRNYVVFLSLPLSHLRSPII